jgi:uncharacterized protein (DUF1015 family)
MTDVRPFRGLRYDPERVDLSRVVVPPYDVITPEERLAFWDRDPHCAIRLILTREPAAEAAASARPTGASACASPSTARCASRTTSGAW